MTEPLRNHGDHGGATAVYAVQAPQWHRASGVRGEGYYQLCLDIVRDILSGYIFTTLKRGGGDLKERRLKWYGHVMRREEHYYEGGWCERGCNGE